MDRDGSIAAGFGPGGPMPEVRTGWARGSRIPTRDARASSRAELPGSLHGDDNMSGAGTEKKGSLTSGVTRRGYLQPAASAGAALLMPPITPASALGRGGAVAPSERITLAGIGIGSRGEFVLKWMLPEPDVRFVAICDVRKQ